ncbi:mandelate racemase [Advenella kashmirensis W13003]|uniref:Mandelate racemase n=1 Tax=Advenella kashmirensis W13003 TaxID=1424334 RepID=V8QTN1_9BURK|nr:mandelate racemase/muconate lactonizing enzyme family protein [Advenella kashmirensis]ETF02670.1 mandelate racemase [Advenella kashmirensis W13003]
MQPLKLARADALVFRAPIAEPVQTSFGIMYDRPAVLVRIESVEGVVGWGEIWCNFPSVGAEHRARIFQSCVAPILLGQTWDNPAKAFEALHQRLRVLAIQSGEPGTLAQAIAGADIALWDMAARLAEKPLWQLCGGSRNIDVYASGISPTHPQELAKIKQAEGYRAFKLKVGFGRDRDIANLNQLRDLIGQDTPLMIDANQAWSMDDALDMLPLLQPFGLAWLEEPLTADSSLDEWKQLAQASTIPLAAGENIRGIRNFELAIESGAFGVIQPDLGKWGGFSGCVPVGRAAVTHQRLFCPHWLGAGVGLVASMHLKAIVGGPGYVEVDSNPNPLRDLIAEPYLKPEEGRISLSEVPGLGITPDLGSLKPFQVQY